MDNAITRFSGTQVKGLLSKAVGGIYIGKNFQGIVTDFFSDFAVTDEGLVITINKLVTVKMPIAEDETYINYAITGETDDEEWTGSINFDYKFEVENYTICFNTTDKGKTFTLEQFKELTASEYGRVNMFRVESIDGCSVSVSMSECDIDIENDEITISSDKSEIVLHKSVVNAIYNDSVGANAVCYRIEFSNGIPDISVEIDYKHRVFK